MLRIDGERDFPQPPAELFGRLADLTFVVGCIPDVAAVHEIAANRASLTVKPGFSFVRGNLHVDLEVLESTAPSRLRVLGRGKGIGSSNDVEVTLGLAPRDTGTRIHWTAEVKNLTGLLRAVPRGLVQAAAQKVINDAWSAVERRLVDSA